MVSNPLEKDKRWTNLQSFPYPTITLRGNYKIATEERTENKSFKVSQFCRESMIYRIAHSWQSQTTKLKSTGPKPWRRRKFLVSQILIDGKTPLSFEPCSVTKLRTSDDVAVLDTVAGLPCFLLDINRKAYWNTVAKEDGGTRWNGPSNGMLYHPALLSIALGFFRQAWLLLRQGLKDDILKTVDSEQVDSVFLSGDRDKASYLVKQLENWIHPPHPFHHQNALYLPFSWKGRGKFWVLERAISKHGYQGVFGTSSVEKAWDLEEVVLPGMALVGPLTQLLGNNYEKLLKLV